MNISTALTDADKQMIHSYLRNYGTGWGDDIDCMPLESIDHYLRYWYKNKEALYNMFGGSLILRKEVRFERPKSDIEREMDNLIYGYSDSWVIRQFVSNYYDGIREIADDYYYYLRGFVDSVSYLVNNIYSGPSFTIPAHYTVNKQALQVNSGCKTVKMLGKITKALGIFAKDYVCQECGARHNADAVEYGCGCGGKVVEQDGYEEFRKAHSLVLNQKFIKGNLCLSIHPMDYMTMSDNDCGWSSCMAWREEPGDYRLGTVEMMNSPYVIVAYLESNTPMVEPEWNSKRWRQLVIITPELILGNRQYPYSSDDLQGSVLRWVRELANESLYYGTFDDNAVVLHNNSANTIGDMRINLNLHFDYMYNDLSSNMGFVSNRMKSGSYYRLLSGPAVCASCGDIIEDTNDHSAVWCKACGHEHYCECCGETFTHDPYTVNGRTYCDWCYHNELPCCDDCGAVCNTTNNYFVCVNPSNPEDSANWTLEFDLCNDCVDSEYFKENYGEVILLPRWGYDRQCVLLNNLSDMVIRKFWHYSSDKLIALRDTENEKKRNALIEEIFN